MEFLKQHISTELYQQLEEALKGNDKVKLGNLADGSYVSKRKYDDEAQKVADLTAQIAERDKQIVSLGKSASDNDELQKQIKALQEANDITTKEWQAKIEKQAFDFALTSELKDRYRAKDVLSVMPHLNTEAISYKDGKLLGLDEQMTEIVASKAFLFGDLISSGTGSPATPPAPNIGGAWDFGFNAVNNTNKN